LVLFKEKFHNSFKYRIKLGFDCIQILELHREKKNEPLGVLS